MSSRDDAANILVPNLNEILRLWSQLLSKLEPKRLHEGKLPPYESGLVYQEEIASRIDRDDEAPGRKPEDPNSVSITTRTLQRWLKQRAVRPAALQKLVDSASCDVGVLRRLRRGKRIADELDTRLGALQAQLDQQQMGACPAALIQSLHEATDHLRRIDPRPCFLEVFDSNLERVRRFLEEGTIDATEAIEQIRLNAIYTELEALTYATGGRAGELLMINASIDSVSSDVWLQAPLNKLLDKPGRLLSQRKYDRGRRIYVVKKPSAYSPSEAQHIVATIRANLAARIEVALLCASHAHQLGLLDEKVNLAVFGGKIAFLSTAGLDSWKVITRRNARGEITLQLERFHASAAAALRIARKGVFFTPEETDDVERALADIGFLIPAGSQKRR